MIKCEKCDKENPEGFDFCEQCVSPLFLETDQEPEFDDNGNDYFNLPEGYQFSNRYIIKKKIGKSSGLGATYEALDNEIKKKVVFKIFRKRFFTSERTFSELEKLFHNLKLTDHRSLARVLDFGIHSKNYYYVSEYMEGDDLRHILQKKNAPFNVKELNKIFIQLLDVISYAHSQKLIHGGLNSLNIIYNEKTKRIGLIDFGITKILSGENKNLLKEDGALRMNLFYTAPEILLGEKADNASDLYSIGAVIYELACNYLPFKSHSSYRLVTYILNETPQAPSIVNPDIPLFISDTVLSLLEKNPKDRLKDINNLLLLLKKSSKKEFKSIFLWLLAIITETALILFILYLIFK